MRDAFRLAIADSAPFRSRDDFLGLLSTNFLFVACSLRVVNLTH